MEKIDKLNELIKKLAIISRNSHDIYWMSTSDFKTCVFLNDAYENIFRYPKGIILKDLKVFSSYLKRAGHECYNPFLEMVKKTQQEGPNATYNETFHIIRGGDGRIRTVNDCGHPLYDEHGEHLGFSGVARDISSDLIRKQLPNPIMNFFQLSDRKKYYLKGKYKNIYLSPRQAECALYLLQGKTAKQTAKILKLSPRTIEEVIGNIKAKLGLHYRSDIFDALIESDFIDILIN